MIILLKKNNKHMKIYFVKVFHKNFLSMKYFKRFIKYSKKLRFDEKPDYELCRKMFKNLMN